MALNKNKTRKLSPSFSKKDEENALWSEVAKTVKRQASSRISPVALPAKGQKKFPRGKTTSLNTKKVVTVRNTAIPGTDTKHPGLVAGPVNLSQGVCAGIDRSSAKKLRQGEMLLEARLDLHGLSQLVAYERLKHFIHKSRQEGLRTILVITGKGKAGRGVLRENVPQWLSETPLSEAIIAFGIARPKDGGEGALYVRLKRVRERL